VRVGGGAPREGIDQFETSRARHYLAGDFVPAAPLLHAHSRGPSAPLRSRPLDFARDALSIAEGRGALRAGTQTRSPPAWITSVGEHLAKTAWVTAWAAAASRVL
jgi:hypothetical protein